MFKKRIFFPVTLTLWMITCKKKKKKALASCRLPRARTVRLVYEARASGARACLVGGPWVRAEEMRPV